jgi:hypothetical protein
MQCGHTDFVPFLDKVNCKQTAACSDKPMIFATAKRYNSERQTVLFLPLQSNGFTVNMRFPHTLSGQTGFISASEKKNAYTLCCDIVSH